MAEQAGDGGNTTQLLISEGINTSIVEEESGDFELFPNPARDYIQVINKGQAAISQLKIFNSTGQMVLSKEYANQFNYTQLDVSELTKGMYFISLGK